MFDPKKIINHYIAKDGDMHAQEESAAGISSKIWKLETILTRENPFPVKTATMEIGMRKAIIKRQVHEV